MDPIQIRILSPTLIKHGSNSDQNPEPRFDQTLVQFDAALGEGVYRMGSAIERLREAMDDLIEQLESTKKR